MKRTRIIHVKRRNGEERASAGWLRSAVRAIRAGKLVAFPTETVYGVGALATNAEAAERLRELKDRPKSPFTVHLGDPAEARRYVRDVPIRARTLMSKAWPGPLTVLLATGGRFADPSLGTTSLYRRICPDGVVGLRCPGDAVARALLGRAGGPVLASSANLAGKAAPRSAREVLAQLDGKIDLLLDGGVAKYGKASTIVAFEGEDFRVVRPGAYDARKIAKMTCRSILFVCTGNTCRSPMAAGLARKLLADDFGCPESKLESVGQEFLSAGVFTGGGARAADNAIAAAARRGADIGAHRSRCLTNALIRSADLVFCMSRSHVAEVTRMVPEAAGKVQLLDAAGDIADPIGGGESVYGRVAGRIERSLRRRIKEKVL